MKRFAYWFSIFAGALLVCMLTIKWQREMDTEKGERIAGQVFTNAFTNTAMPTNRRWPVASEDTRLSSGISNLANQAFFTGVSLGWICRDHGGTIDDAMLFVDWFRSNRVDLVSAWLEGKK